MSKMRLDAVKVLSGLALTLVILASFDGVVSAQNLVQNPGFEQGSAGWGGGQVVAASPHKGLACLLVNDDKADTSVAASTQKTLPVTQGQGYRFSVWVRAEKAGQKTLLTLNQVDGADKWISGSNMDFVFSSGTTWSEFHVVLRSFHPNAAAVRVTLRPVKWTSAGELTGKAWFDDVALSKDSVSDTTFGAWIRKTGKTRVWVAPVEQKVSPDAVLSTSSPDLQEIHLEAARGEYQPFQIVLDPQVAETLTSVLVSDARDKTTGATLPSAAWTARRVAFLKVTRPTDWGSKTGWRPDPLPLFKGPLSLEAHKAQPLWLTLAVPQNATPGNYTATLTLSFQATGVVTLPLVVKVWGFSMPKTHHLRTAYGLSMPAIDTYHHLGGDKTKRRDVFRRYLKDFAAHRISPYNPMGDAGFSVSFPGWNWGGGAIVVDPAAPTGGNHVLEINDTRTDSAMSATTEVFPIDKTKTHTLSWRVRTDGAHSYLVNVKQFDASGSWISGANIDYLKNGSGTWQTQTVTVQASAFRTQTTSVRISLYARAWTSSGELIGKTFFDDISMVKTGDTKNLVSNGDLEISPSQLQAKVDFSAFDAAATYALDTLGFDSFRLPLSGFGWGDISGTHPGRILTFEWGTKAYEDIFCSEVKAITDHLAKKGWLNRAYVYWMDEPRPADYDFVNYGMDLIHRCDPRLARLLTEQAEAKLIGHVDIWVPILNEYGPVWAHDRQAHGDAVWWYVCTGPKSPYPTNFIDHPGIEHRVRFWMAWQYGVQGSLYWATNYWSSRIAYPPPKMQDPWT
ncbi:MAG: carbohydrate binding domain-containing protein, partial [Deltaproteobacteria bacterium]|nr:carbohydrate binding domain-containing protein [Deltaproteobacteria bacterium]